MPKEALWWPHTWRSCPFSSWCSLVWSAVSSFQVRRQLGGQVVCESQTLWSVLNILLTAPQECSWSPFLVISAVVSPSRQLLTQCCFPTLVQWERPINVPDQIEWRPIVDLASTIYFLKPQTRLKSHGSRCQLPEISCEGSPHTSIFEPSGLATSAQ